MEFHTGLGNRYTGVPPNIYADLMHSDEIGKYFSGKARPRFHTKQVDAPECSGNSPRYGLTR
jgi:hypothetical protein